MNWATCISFALPEAFHNKGAPRKELQPRHLDTKHTRNFDVSLSKSLWMRRITNNTCSSAPAADPAAAAPGLQAPESAAAALPAAQLAAESSAQHQPMLPRALPVSAEVEHLGCDESRLDNPMQMLAVAQHRTHAAAQRHGYQAALCTQGLGLTSRSVLGTNAGLSRRCSSWSESSSSSVVYSELSSEPCTIGKASQLSRNR